MNGGFTLYFSFLLTLVVGLTGLSLFLNTAVENVLVGWDPLHFFWKRRKKSKEGASAEELVGDEMGLALDGIPRALTTRLTTRQISKNLVKDLRPFGVLGE